MGTAYEGERKMRGKKFPVLDLCGLLLSGLLLLGVLTFLAPCAPHEDGSFMSCHWAGRAAAGAGAALTALSLLRLALREERIKLGVDLAVLPVSLLALSLPGGLISLCMMPQMRCRSLMAPGVRVLSLLIFALSALSALLRRRSGTGEGGGSI